MTIIPKLMSQWWETLERPHRLLDQHFGLTMNPEKFLRANFNRRLPASYVRPLEEFFHDDDFWRDDDHGYSVVKADKDKFHVALDVQQFKPEEINVKLVDNCIVVEGKHEEKRDDHGFITRHFIRKYVVPEQCEAEKTTSLLSSDGILTISAPRKAEAIEDLKEIPIKIEKTGKPVIEKKEEPQEKQKIAASN